jgi:predicted MPP superfamily phosphohydrolase
MTLTVALLIVAGLTAVLPLVSTRLAPPASIRDLEKSFVVAVVTVIVGAAVVALTNSFGHFGIIHLGYLLGVVTIPMLLGGWYVTGRIRGQLNRWIRLGGAVAVVIALVGIWGTHIEPNWLRTDRVALIAPVTQPLTIGVLADLQTPNIGSHEQRAIDALLAEQPDIVLIPGDLFQGPYETIVFARPGFVRLLQQLTDQVELVAIVSGDADRDDMVAEIAALSGVLFVENQVTELTVAGQPVRLAGVSVANRRERLDTLASLQQPTDALTILLAHRPGVVYDLSAADVDLIVAGHTHGGQISVPLFGPPVTLSSVPRSVAAGGLGVVDNYPIYVSTGVGLERGTAPQVRLGVRPSVGIIEVLPPPP